MPGNVQGRSGRGAEIWGTRAAGDVDDQVVMKVLVLLPKLTVGGTVELALQWARCLEAVRADPRFACLTDGHPAGVSPSAAGIRERYGEIEGLGHRARGDSLRTALRLRELTRRIGADVVHTFFPYAERIASVAAWGRCVTTVGTIVSSQHSPPHPLRTWARRRFSGPSWFTPDLWIAVGRTVRERAVSAGYPEQRIRVIWSGYGVPESKPRTASWESGPIVLITVGRLVESKGVGVLLRVLAGLPEHFTLQVVGDGPQRARLQEMAGGLGVTGRVTFLGYRDDVSALLHAAHIFVTATRHEGLAGYALLEAASAGMPIVCSDIPEIREVFEKDEVIAVPQAGERQFAEAIRGIDGKTAERLGALARARVISAFRPESIGAGLLSAYGEVSRLRASLPPDGASPSPSAGRQPGA